MEVSWLAHASRRAGGRTVTRRPSRGPLRRLPGVRRGPPSHLNHRQLKLLRRPKRPTEIKPKQLSTTDILAPATMKNAAKCDTYCELQNSGNHRVFERILRPRLVRGHACLSVCTPHPSPSGGDLVVPAPGAGSAAVQTARPRASRPGSVAVQRFGRYRSVDRPTVRS